MARAAQAAGVRFCALKAISDELDFPVLPTQAFIDAQGRFKTLNFAAYVALRPRLWAPARGFKRNCSAAAQALAAALKTLVSEATQGNPQAMARQAAEPVPAAGVEARS